MKMSLRKYRKRMSRDCMDYVIAFITHDVALATKVILTLYIISDEKRFTRNIKHQCKGIVGLKHFHQ